MNTAPSVCVCVCVCVCVSTAPGVCVCLDGSNAENKISLLIILCIILYVTKKTITDYGKMLKYREKYR